MNNVTTDVLVIGSGAGGFSAAVTAAYHGLSVTVVEKADVCGGATSWSGGWMWTPGNPLAKADGVDEDPELFRTYLKSVIGEHYEEERIDAFLEAVPNMVGFFHNKTSLQFVPGAKINDIYGNNPGAGTGHRSVGPKPINARAIKKPLRKKLRGQLYETSFLGMGIMAGPDLAAFLNAMRGDVRSFFHCAWRVGFHVWDLIWHRQGMQLVNGTALTGRLAKSADNLGVDIRVSTPAKQLLTEESGRVTGAVVGSPEGDDYTITATRGVVLATGGFPNDVERRKQFFARTPTGNEHWTLAPASTTGDGINLAESVGGHFRHDVASAAAWCPVSLMPYRSGRIGTFPHIPDRAKPGNISVLRSGKRFVNEANGYYDYVEGMVQSVPEGDTVESWMIADHTFARRYPVGMAKPRPVPLFPYVRNGYIVKARTLEGLARKCGIDPSGLRDTVATFNANARAGVDPEYGRGETPFNRSGGDATNPFPNPSLAPLDKGPFYAVRILPGSFGTFAGVSADEKARVLTAAGEPVEGLYVAGNDQVNVMGGHYPAGGINLGPAMTFGYIAARDIAGVTDYETTHAAERTSLRTGKASS